MYNSIFIFYLSYFIWHETLNRISIHLVQKIFHPSQTCDEKYNIPNKNTIHPSIYLPYLQIEYVKINFLKYFQFTQFCFYL